jgi:catechol 2,3-dioxygenase-like lactoylglutathione lyase family enzyme
VNVLGLVFVGTRTSQPAAMTAFARDVLGLVPRETEGTDAVFFDLPDGSSFAVQPAGDDVEEHAVGFLVDDVRTAAAEVRAAGHDVDDVSETAGFAYVHVRAPDGRLYELVQRLPVHAGEQPGEDRRPA